MKGISIGILIVSSVLVFYSCIVSEYSAFLWSSISGSIGVGLGITGLTKCRP